ncbi:MAG TPA: hypothetical protein VK447_00150 [Myxococcaceae bacterium]|nr:hypothetical protein [Myxococcaceae bacterium]
MCTEVLGENCLEKPCPEGQRCSFTFISSWSHRLPMACVDTCGPDKDCANGGVCWQGRCFQPCSPAKLEVCGPHTRCESVNDDNLTYLCQLVPY